MKGRISSPNSSSTLPGVERSHCSHLWVIPYRVKKNTGWAWKTKVPGVDVGSSTLRTGQTNTSVLKLFRKFFADLEIPASKTVGIFTCPMWKNTWITRILQLVSGTVRLVQFTTRLPIIRFASQKPPSTGNYVASPQFPALKKCWMYQLGNLVPYHDSCGTNVVTPTTHHPQ